jgi:hypothetical protein
LRSPYLNTTEIAVLLRFLKRDGSPNEKRARRWLDDMRVPTRFAGRQVIALAHDVQGALVFRKDWDGVRRQRRVA